MDTKIWNRCSHAALIVGLALPAFPTQAQTARAGQAESTAAQVDEVVVSARKRQESDISVPVSITAISKEQIERQAILNMYDVAQRTPALQISNSGTGVGGTIFLRGIGTTSSISGTLDQSVSLDIDGASISRGNVLRIGDYDLDQLTILKGPQALFFGKNSPAGVISFRSKDPTSQLELSSKLSYEPYANNRFGEFVVSGPVTDTLRARLFVHTGASDGSKDNLAALALPANSIVPNSVFAPSHSKAGRSNENFVRGTVVYEPNDVLKIRLMTSYDDQRGDGVGAIKERFYCPQGHAQNTTAAALLGAGPNTAALAQALSVDDCKLNGAVVQGNLNPALLTKLPRQSADGITDSLISLSVLQADYKLSDHIDLTSVTTYTRISERNYDGFAFGPASISALNGYANLLYSQFSQELRAATHFNSRVNFAAGAYYQDADLGTYTYILSTPPYTVWRFDVPNKVYSIFGQAILDVTSQVELAGGARFTHEKKRLDLTRSGVPQPTANPSASFKNVSPEATLTWRPSSDLTAYVAYKTGFKSGGYAAVLAGESPPLPTTAPLRDFLYRPEKAKGFEMGVKAALLDRSVRLDTTAYSYEYSDLQASSADPSVLPPIQRVFNAASARQRGIEVEGTYYPKQFSGLRINGTANYNDSHYKKFDSPCYIGQAIIEGCNLTPVRGVFTAQSLAGRRFTNAPLWVGALGFSYSHPVGNGRMRFEVGSDAVYKSSYNVTSDLSPGGLQKASTIFSGQVRLISDDGGWEVGVYGKNLTNEYRAVEAVPVPLTGTSSRTGTANGGPSARADLLGNTNPGRAVFFQIVVRPSAWMK